MNPIQHWKPILAGAVGGGLILALVLAGFSSGEESAETAMEVPAVESDVFVETTDETDPQEVEEEVIIEKCTIEDLENAAGILQLQAAVINPVTNELIYDVGANIPARTASVMKLLTAAAALETLGPNYRVETRVYADADDPSKIYLVGGGDVTLSRLGPGESSVYKDAPKLSSLALSVNSYLGSIEPEQQVGEIVADPNAPVATPVISEIVLDTSLWGGVDGAGQWERNWNLAGIKDGWMSQASALQVDGDRQNPKAGTSPRSNKPVERAGIWFQEAIGENAEQAVLSYGIAPADAIEIAKVRSAPMSEWIRYMLRTSDNTLAEAVARLVTYEVGLDGSGFYDLTRSFQSALANTGINFSEIQVEDGSGLSAYSVVSPATIAQLMELVVEGYPNFEQILTGLPVSGETGSLDYRFKEGELANAAGKILAKTGWIRTGYTLAGTMTAADNSKLVFAVYNLGNVTTANRDALDEFVYGIYECGAELRN